MQIEMNADTDIIRDDIRALSAYHVQESAGGIKLDAMENPFVFPEGLRDGLSAALREAVLNRYPDPRSRELTSAIRTAMQVPAGLNIMLGNGSDEIIQLIATAVAKPGATLLSVEPAFVMFKMIATFCQLNYIGVPLRTGFEIDSVAMIHAIDAHQPAVTFIAYPNNPTGNLFQRDAINAIIDRSKPYGGLVVIDEAYFAFADDSFLSDVLASENVVLMRTVSKLGLAGLRLGMLFGSPRWLDEFDKVRLPYNINILTQAAATFALAHYDAFLAQAAVLKAERSRVAQHLAVVDGIAVFPSQANFLLIRTRDSAHAFAALRAAKILVKHTAGSHPLLANTLRLTIGSPAENDALLNVLTTLSRS